ncbi:uncharacterized protein LOC116001716 isoform X2 [Ipomoea triloba]|uniref:uncharacterized protein LOC116001716 isoform X2 n=1 Tax=Ipomoea triloba TaxID=35885 RepID=UPI00125DA710|nr:uncharacterized protein LOC116001716 isoform X2 [Ipomoea triloba]
MATAAKAPVYVSWDEVCLSADKGRKEVHYYLKRRDGLSDLAVVGTEKGMRHISYHYAIKPMSLLSVSNSSSLSKLRTRREVVDWLNSIVSDLRHHRDIRDDGQPCEGTDAVLNDMNALKDVHLWRQGQRVTEFTWLGSSWTCRKKRCHYTSFCRNGVRISVHDFVYVLAEEDKRLVAYLDDMYEDTRGNRMVVVRWFHKIDEVGILLPHNYNDREILFSLCLQNLSIECVDGQATVLCPQHYEKFLNDVRHTQSEPYVCQRLFDNDDLKPFDITSVKGYWNQELLKRMSFSSPLRAQPSPLGELKVEDRVTGFVESRPNKRLRVSKESNISSQSVPQKGPAKACQEYCNGSSIATMEISTSKEGCFDGSISGKVVVTEKTQQNFDIGSEVEILSQDSGIRGCWFRALVIKKHNNKVKVQYKDVKDAEDETKNLEEWVLATKLAASDKLGIRIHGRTVLRPSPSSYKGRVSWAVNVGAIVDAWWNEGWWEGIVVRKESEDRLHIYFPGEKETHIFGHSDLRHSQEWLADGWKHLKERHELVSVLLGDSTVKQTVKESSDVILERHTTCSNGVHHLSTEKPRDEVASAGNTDADAGERLKVLEGVHDLSKDNRLAQLRWKTSGKRRRCRSPVNKVRLSFERNQNVTKESGMQIKETLFIPSSLKVDLDNCKYITDSLFNSSVVSPLSSLVMSR